MRLKSQIILYPSYQKEDEIALGSESLKKKAKKCDSDPLSNLHAIEKGKTMGRMEQFWGKHYQEFVLKSDVKFN
jgi:hypothetical protein